MRVIWTVAGGLLAATVTAGAMDIAMDRTSVDAALSVGQSRIERDRTRYHAAYRIMVARPPLDYIEIISPFRRVVLAAEARALIGDRSFGQRQALELLSAADRQVDIRAEFTFHPLNNYVTVPAYLLRLEERDAAILPRTFERAPRFGSRVDGTPPPLPVPGGIAPGDSQPMLGGSLVARFDGGRLNPNGAYDVVVEEEGKELARVRVDFGQLR